MLKAEADAGFYWIFLCANSGELSGTDTVFELLGFLSIGQVLGDLGVHPVLEVHIELVLEGVSPMILVSQALHALLEIGSQETLCNIEALELGNSIQLLFSLLSSIFKRLILLLDPLYFSLNLLLPLSLLSLPLLMVTLLILPYLIQLVLLLDLESRLLE